MRRYWFKKRDGSPTYPQAIGASKSTFRTLPPSNKGLRKRLVFGFGAQALTMFATTAEQFLMVPLYLYAWGVALYEDWLLLGAAAGALVRFMDFGLERYYSASIRMSLAAGSRQEFDRYLATGLGTYLSIMLAALILISAGVMLPVRHILGLSALSEYEASTVFWFMMAGRLLMMPKAVIRPIYSAHGDFSRGENMYTFSSLALVLFQATMLLFGASALVLSVTGFAALFFTSWLPILVDQRRRYPGIHQKPSIPSTSELRQTMAKSKYYMVRDWGDIFILQLPMLLIGHFAEGTGSVLIFRLTRVLTGLARQFTVQLARITGIELSRQLAQRDRVGLERLYLSAGRSIGGMTGLVCAGIIVVAEPFIEIWTGGRAPFDSLLLYAFVAGVMIGGPGQNAIMLLSMSNYPRPLAIGMIVQVSLLLILMATLTPRFGPLGAAVALGFSDCIFTVWCSYWASQRFRLPEYRYAGLSFGSEVTVFAFGIGAGLLTNELIPMTDVATLILFCLMFAVIVSGPFLYLALNKAQRERFGLSWRLLGSKAQQRTPRSVFE